MCVYSCSPSSPNHVKSVYGKVWFNWALSIATKKPWENNSIIEEVLNLSVDRAEEISFKMDYSLFSWLLFISKDLNLLLSDILAVSIVCRTGYLYPVQQLHTLLQSRLEWSTASLRLTGWRFVFFEHKWNVKMEPDSGQGTKSAASK